MAFEQNYHQPHCTSVEDVVFKQNWNLVSAPTTASRGVDRLFECSICLDSARDPVVTLCGHLYCWPCIYKWLHVQTSEQHPNCPVCKANISKSTLVPLYGRGNSVTKKAEHAPIIPDRPTALNVASHTNPQLHSNPFRPQMHSSHQQQYFPQPFASASQLNFGGPVLSSFFSPTVGTFGEMVFQRMFGSSDRSLFSYPYSNSYPHMGNGGSPRARWEELQVDKFLNRVSIFLFCCFILCLLLF